MTKKKPTTQEEKEQDFISFMDFMWKHTWEIQQRVELEGRDLRPEDLPPYEELSELFDLYKTLGLHK